jgi:hypothetical protein
MRTSTPLLAAATSPAARAAPSPAAALPSSPAPRRSRHPSLPHTTDLVILRRYALVDRQKLQTLDDEAAQLPPRRSREATLADAAVVFADILTSAGVDLTPYNNLLTRLQARGTQTEETHRDPIWSRGNEAVAVREVYKDEQREGVGRVRQRFGREVPQSLTS